MSATQIYEQTIRPLSTKVVLVADTPQTETGFTALKRLLPQIERITVTDENLEGVVLKRLYKKPPAGPLTPNNGGTGKTVLASSSPIVGGGGRSGQGQ